MPEQAHNNIKLFLKGKPNAEGQELWENWYENHVVIKEDYDLIYSSEDKIIKELNFIKKTKSWIFIATKSWVIAASLIIIFGFSSFFLTYTSKHNSEEYTTKKGERANITLSDGTQIWLNAASTLKYPTEFKGDTREVYLTGEAFFDVAKDKVHPFIIHTNNMETKVLGTSFNVRAYSGQENQEVAVITGKVNVRSTLTNENVYVTPGKKVALNVQNNKFYPYKSIQTSTISVWRNDIIVFEEIALPEVIATISRNYNVAIKIENENLNDLKISAYFKVLPPDQIIGLVCKIVNATYTLENGIYVIK
jgi:ferric-dicitrate binding protein FerR (iron transport regulator)